MAFGGGRHLLPGPPPMAEAIFSCWFATVEQLTEKCQNLPAKGPEQTMNPVNAPVQVMEPSVGAWATSK